ncbi:MAG: lytic transglycosylase domain-containing protein [Huintestinicola sp.]
MYRAADGKRRKKKKSNAFTPLAAAVLITITVFMLPDFSRNCIYPQHYSGYVEIYSRKYGVDPTLVYAVIKTESNFDPNVESDVGARGLMQLMDDAFEWVSYRMKDDRDLDYDCMFEPEYNIEYGTYLLKLLLDEYGDKRTALAAYHSGRGQVNSWLKDTSLSSDGKKLDNIPSSVTNHYVDKVMSAYDAYNNLY